MHCMGQTKAIAIIQGSPAWVLKDAARLKVFHQRSSSAQQCLNKATAHSLPENRMERVIHIESKETQSHAKHSFCATL